MKKPYLQKIQTGCFLQLKLSKFSQLKSRIKKNEGYSNQTYYDQVGKLTIGFGHLIKKREKFLHQKKYLKKCLEAGAKPENIVFSGVGKTREEMEYALSSGILMFNVESEQEMEVLNEVARSKGVVAPVSFRINPDVDPQTHPYISTGMKKSKFGIGISLAVAAYRRAIAVSYTHLTLPTNREV